MTEKTFETIVSVLVNSKIQAENNNKKGINNTYIKSINNALKELKTLKQKNIVQKNSVDLGSGRPWK